MLVELTAAILMFYAERQSGPGGYETSNSIFKTDADLHRWSFVECLYFCLMTLSTVGGNRKFPSTGFGQILAGICVIVGVFIARVPFQIVVHSFTDYYKNLKMWSKVAQHRREVVVKIRKLSTRFEQQRKYPKNKNNK